MMNRIALVSAFALSAQLLAAQDDGFQCIANPPHELARRMAMDPQYLLRAQEAKAALDARTAAYQRGGGSFVIPVVFHIIHQFGAENIADAQVIDAVRILNEDFNRQNPDWGTVRPEFVGIVDDVGIEFRLAQRDPEGNCTSGITRTASPLTNEGSFEMTQLIQWPRDRYMNVWVCLYANGAAGYTYYPMWLDGWPEADGIVVRHDYLGSIGTSTPYRARVLSHEVGHWLNLKHCWGDSNSPGDEENCFMDDEVEDTPLTKGWTSCLASGSSCGSDLDNVQNYMEYAYCGRMFTEGQGARMLAALTSPIAQRENLWQPTNLAITGAFETPAVCAARFEADRRTICAGGTVQFTDQSFNGIVARNWAFPGGEPASSELAVAEVTYAEPGLYPVSLQVSDGTNTLEQFEQDYIHVISATGEPAPWSEGFESVTTLPNAQWEVLDPGSNGTFAPSSAAAFSGNASARLVNAQASAGLRDELRSMNIDLSGAEGAVLSFRYAYARRTLMNEDALYVWVSADCGDSWVLRRVLRPGTGLLTAGVIPGVFVPSGPNDWRYAEITNIGAHLCTSSFRVRFEFISDGGNDLFLDDINIQAAVVGVPEAAREMNGLQVAMSEAGEFHVLFRTDRPIALGWEVFDATGRIVERLQASTWTAGSHRFHLPVEALAPGAYLLRPAGGIRSDAVRFVKP